MMKAGLRLVATAASRIDKAIYMAGRVVPSIRWMKYAALRLGAFIISYFLIVAAIVIGLIPTSIKRDSIGDSQAAKSLNQ